MNEPKVIDSRPAVIDKEKRTKRENTDIDIGYRISIPGDVHPRQGIPSRRPRRHDLKPEDFFSGEYDPVDLAVAVTDGTRNDRALWRTYLRTDSITECDFLQCCFVQWRENESDGYPRNAACLTKKLRPFLNGRGAKGGLDRPSPRTHPAPRPRLRPCRPLRPRLARYGIHE